MKSRGTVVEAFAVDVNGTITENGGAIDLDAAHSLKWLEKMGHKVILVSGRGLWDTFALAVYLGTTPLVVAENGGVVATSPVDVAVLGDKYACLQAYELLARTLDRVDEGSTFPRISEVRLERTFDLEEGQRILRESGLPLQLIDSKYAYHIVSKDVNKARGLVLAFKKVSVHAQRVVAIGDSDTDIPMFKLCGCSIALGNAPEAVRRAATFTVKAAYGAGLVEAVQLVTTKYMKGRIRG